MKFKPRKMTAADKDFVLYASAAMTGIMLVISSFAYGKNPEASAGAFLGALLWVLTGLFFLRRYGQGKRTIGIFTSVLLIAALSTFAAVMFLYRPFGLPPR